MFGWGKGKDIYSSILDVYPQLIDSNGKFDKSLAETIINTRTMSDESKSALQNIINLAQQAEDAYNELNDYMTGIFGSLGESMTDALVNAFSMVRMQLNLSLIQFQICLKRWLNRWFTPLPSLH